MKLVARSSLDNTSSFDNDFVQLQQRVREEPYKSGMMPEEVWFGLLNMPFPRPIDFWIVYDGSNPVGHLSANINLTDRSIGYVGCFEVDLSSSPEECAKLLLTAGKEFLQSNSATKIYGPINISTWFPYRLQNGTYEERTFSWEPCNPPEYNMLFEKSGFVAEEDYHSTQFSGIDNIIDYTRPLYEKAMSKGFSIREFDPKNIMETEVPILHRITLESFADNFLFEPIGLEQFKQLYVPIAKKANFDYAGFAVSPEGKEVGYFFCFQDIDTLVLKSVGILPEARKHALSHAMMFQLFSKAKSAGIDKFTSGLVKTNAISQQRIENLYSQHAKTLFQHKYILYSA